MSAELSIKINVGSFCGNPNSRRIARSMRTSVPQILATHSSASVLLLLKINSFTAVSVFFPDLNGHFILRKDSTTSDFQVIEL